MKRDISISVERVDHWEKASGNANYIGDIKLDGMLYAKTIRSDRPRARIKSIKIPVMPEGYYIIDRRDIPGINRVKIVFNDQPFFAEDIVNYIGEPILLVVGPDKQRILDIVPGIYVDYEDIKPVLTMEDAENPEIQPIFEGKNYFADYSYCRGDVDRIFSNAGVVIEGEYSTGYQEQAYLEPQGVMGVYENGKISVYGSFQCPYYVKNALIQAFGWEGDRIRAVQATTGGAFGGKEDYPSLIAGHVAFAAYKTGKPVQLIFDRSEDLEVTTKRHPSLIKLKTALDEDNNIIAMQADIKLNAGAYSGLSNVVLQRAMFNITGVYKIPNLKVSGRIVATNTVPTGAFRGFGGPQAVFAIETHMQKIAHRLGLDPLDFKMKHLVKKGDRTATGGTFRQEVKLPEMLETMEKTSMYREKYVDFKNMKDGSIKGIGTCLFLHGCGFTGSGERDFIKSVVKLKKYKDGKVEILAANVDMGQGLKTTLRKIVSEALEIPLEDTICENPDTDRVPDSGPTVASRSVMIVGKLLEEAAIELKSKWNEPGELEVIKNYKHPEDMVWDNEKFCGDAYPAYAWGVNTVEVEIDPVTYEIEVKGVWTVFDVGKTIDEKVMQGQVEGGVLQGLSYGALEVMECKNGKIQQRTVTDYIIPTSMDFVRIENKFIDNLYKDGPSGAKGAGELTLLGAGSALAAAVSNALGVSIDRLPVTPEYLMEVMKNAKRD